MSTTHPAVPLPASDTATVAGAHWPGQAVPRQGEIAPARGPAEFHLTRRFAWLSLVVIVLVSLATSTVLARFLSKAMLQRDAEVSMQFLQHSKLQQHAEEYFLSAAHRKELAPELAVYFQDLVSMPDVLRAQVYDASGTVIWSNESAAMNSHFDGNPELDEALAGRLAVDADLLESRQYIKPEHVFARVTERQFAEYYIPIWNRRHDKVIGVVELYKSPDALFATIRSGLQLIWLCALVGGALVYGALYWLVRRGQSVIAAQQRRIASNEGFAAVGEIASSVAHNIRNPLASIRTSAELLSTDAGSTGQAFARDIMSEVDRLESWIRGLLNYAHAGTRSNASMDTNALLRKLAGDLQEDLARHRTVAELKLDPSLPQVTADELMVDQILRTLVANALDAMPAGGLLVLASGLQGGLVAITVSDTGVGMEPAQLERTFTTPRSTKLHGLGIGLPLVARTVERLGGGIRVRSTPGLGTSVTITLPIVPEKAN